MLSATVALNTAHSTHTIPMTCCHITQTCQVLERGS